MLNSDGNAYQKTVANTEAVAFRPYFVTPAGGGAAQHRAPQQILFDSDDSSFAFGDEPDPTQGEVGQGGLTFSVGRHAVSVTSSMKQTTDVRIVNLNGQTIDSYMIEPGETRKTDIHVSGVYIVRADNGHYTKKIVVK